MMMTLCVVFFKDNIPLAERTRYLKENPKGVQEMCKVMEDMRNESLKEVAKRMLSDGMLTLEKNC